MGKTVVYLRLAMNVEWEVHFEILAEWNHIVGSYTNDKKWFNRDGKRYTYKYPNAHTDISLLFTSFWCVMLKCSSKGYITKFNNKIISQ